MKERFRGRSTVCKRETSSKPEEDITSVEKKTETSKRLFTTNPRYSDAMDGLGELQSTAYTDEIAIKKDTMKQQKMEQVHVYPKSIIVPTCTIFYIIVCQVIHVDFLHFLTRHI